VPVLQSDAGVVPRSKIRITLVARKPAKRSRQREPVSLRDSPREPNVVASPVGLTLRRCRSSKLVKSLDPFGSDVHGVRFVGVPIDVALQHETSSSIDTANEVYYHRTKQLEYNVPLIEKIL